MNNYYSIGIVPSGQMLGTALVKTSGGGGRERKSVVEKPVGLQYAQPSTANIMRIEFPVIRSCFVIALLHP
jgi:hypothetical protein